MSEAFMENSNLKVRIAPPETRYRSTPSSNGFVPALLA